MPDPAPSSSRLEDLRMRWQLDPGSRVYLQLAEEYRKLDRHPEAIEVLKRGLQQRPNDLSGQVALGRCHLEMDELEPALGLLEGVIDRDPAHMVGNKLLLEAYIRSGEAARAGERLDLYKLLNPADPDLETLETRLRSLRAAAPGIPEPGGVTTAEIPIVPRSQEAPAPPDLAELPAEEVFEISAEPELEDVTQRVFEPVAEAPAPARDPAFETSPAFTLPLMAGADAGEEPEEAAAFEEPAFDLVPDEPAPAVPETETELPEPEPAWARALEADELFYLGPPPPPPSIEELWGWPAPAPLLEPPRAAETWTAAEELLPEVPLAEEEAAEEIPPPFEAEADWAAPEPVVQEPAAAEPVAPQAAPGFQAEQPPAEEPATATLGALYLRQGHVSEAEKIFRQVLRRDPRNAAALAGLARIRGETGLTAQALLASAGERIPLGLTAKKVRLLESYLNHLRGAGESHVH
ncbi:MAG TPA: tetratricopeptide repeat protein [Thermoanaerobaculia bacterium]|jgi:tetratricopeptide (TPR) repeat protein